MIEGEHNTVEFYMKAYLGIGPGGKLNYAYQDGYTWTFMKREFNKTDAELNELKKKLKG